MQDNTKTSGNWLPHMGLRKLKSVLAVFVGFCLWQLIRLFVPGLEVHPIYIYIYGIIEMRETSEKTVNLGRLRIKATITALSIGLPLLLLSIFLKSLTQIAWLKLAIELSVILVGVLIVLCVAEVVGCRNLCGLAASIMVILLVSRADNEPFTYSLLRSVQTIMGVFIAWLINVKLFPYPHRQKGRTTE